MSNVHPIRCACRRVSGNLDLSFPVNRCVCYCRSCQAFAHFLGRADAILDQHGGTGVVQTLPQALTLTAGSGELANMRLTPSGALRWYTQCCGTAIANTRDTYRLDFVGVVHDCLHTSGEAAFDRSFGPVRLHVFTEGARNPPAPKATNLLRHRLHMIRLVLFTRIDKTNRRTPFFREDTGQPVLEPRVLTDDEYRSVMEKVDRG